MQDVEAQVPAEEDPAAKTPCPFGGCEVCEENVTMYQVGRDGKSVRIEHFIVDEGGHWNIVTKDSAPQEKERNE